jgi:lipopolysaccharide export system protein LptA
MRSWAAASIAVIALCCAAPVLGQERVNITSDKMVMEEAMKKVVFTGNVNVVHPDVTVKAPMVEVTYGDGGPSDIETFVASGGVSLKSPDQTATGDIAVFDPVTEILRLTGHVIVVNAGGTMAGPELLVNLADNTSTFTADGSGRVTAVFTPE